MRLRDVRWMDELCMNNEIKIVTNKISLLIILFNKIDMYFHA